MGVKASLDEGGLHPRKKWGQNFLTDPRILASIAQAADVTPDDTVLEIGPGLGHLTRVLASHAGRVVAVEVDTDLASRLRTDLDAFGNVTILEGDILQYEPAEWLAAAGIQDTPPALQFKVVANLPYYITSAILRHILEATIRPRTIVVMVQREVAHRMVAMPPEMNLLAVSVQFFARVRIVRTIAPGAFYPRPQVHSSVVRLDVLEQPSLQPSEVAKFFDLVRAGFGERRKQLRNSLAHGLELSPQVVAHLLSVAHIDPTRRAETLTLDEWDVLYRSWQSRRLPRDLKQ